MGTPHVPAAARTIIWRRRGDQRLGHPGQALLEWQRGKAGTIEHVNYILKDELAAGVYPSNKSGANAAWLRLQVLTHNLLELLKATALDAAYRRARPKRLRFAIFTQFGRVVRHAREQYVRVVTRVLAHLLAPGLSASSAVPGRSAPERLPALAPARAARPPPGPRAPCGGAGCPQGARRGAVLPPAPVPQPSALLSTPTTPVTPSLPMESTD